MRMRLADLSNIAAYFILLLAPILTIFSRNIAFLCLLLVFVLVLAHYWAGQKPFCTCDQDPIASARPSLNIINTVALACILYLGASIYWSPVQERAIGAFLQVTTASAIGFWLVHRLNRDGSVPHWMHWGLPTALIIACALLIFELNNGSPIRGLLGASQQFFRLNRAVIFVVLLLPALLLLPAFSGRRLVQFVATILVAWAVFSSDSESAKLAFIASCSVWILSQVIAGKTLLILTGLLILATHVSAPVLVHQLYTWVPAEIYEQLGVPLQHVRSQIWWAYAQMIGNAPLLGHGLQSSFVAQALYSGPDPQTVRGLDFIHPHSFPVQLWFELGFVGILLSTALLTLVLVRLLKSDQRYHAPLAIVMTATWAIAFVSHGAWQHWWWAMVALSALATAAVGKLGQQHASHAGVPR